MSKQSLNKLAWLSVFLAVIAVIWVIYDGTLRVSYLANNAQVIRFSESLDDRQAVHGIPMQKIIDSHLFGVEPVNVKQITETPKLVDAPKTRLNLTLTGLFAGDDPGSGYAMIQIARDQTSIVSVGDNIGDTGASVQAIHVDHILINHRGKAEKLPLNRKLFNITGNNSGDAKIINELELTESELATLTQIIEPEPDSQELKSEDVRGLQEATGNE